MPMKKTAAEKKEARRVAGPIVFRLRAAAHDDGSSLNHGLSSVGNSTVSFT